MNEPSRDEIRAALRSAYRDLVEFASTEAFQGLIVDLYSLPDTARPSFVNEVILNPSALRERGIVPPPEILIQRSSFGDRRPTLFCIKKYLPERLRLYWQNANITFDNPVSDDSIPRDARAWRPPLAFEVQQAMVAGIVANEELPG